MGEEAEAVKATPRRFHGRRRGLPMHDFQRQGDIPQRGQVREKIELLEKKPISLSPVEEFGRVVPKGCIIQLQRAGGGFVQAAAKSEEGALSSTGGADEDQHASFHGERQAIESMERAVGAGEGVGVQLHVRRRCITRR